MRSMQISGLDELDEQLTLAGNAAQGIAKASLYEGANIMANAIHSGLDRIQTEPWRYATDSDKRLPSPEEKAAILSAKFGVAKHEGSGAEVNTVVGLTGSGYVELQGKSGSRRVAAALLLRSIQSGTSFMKAQPIVRRAVNGAKGAATAKIAAEGEARLNKIFND